MYHYSKNLTNRVLEAGIDVFLNTDLAEAGLGEPNSQVQQVIKPEHLSSVISSSLADFLIVIGDRNMRNDTVQARRSGKLVEMSIDERIRTILENWASQAGIRLSPGSSDGDSDRAIESLTDEQLIDNLQRVTGLAHAMDRLFRVQQMSQEIFDLRAKRRSQAGMSGSSSSASLLPDDPLVIGPNDQALVEKLTKTQTNLIRLHKDFADVLLTLSRTPTLPPPRSAGKPDRPSGFVNLGLGSGVIVSGQYHPNTGATSSKRDGAPQHPMPALLHSRLSELAKGYLDSLTSIGEQIVEFVGPSGSGLWRSYFGEFLEAQTKAQQEAQARAQQAAAAASNRNSNISGPASRKNSGAVSVSSVPSSPSFGGQQQQQAAVISQGRQKPLGGIVSTVVAPNLVDGNGVSSQAGSNIFSSQSNSGLTTTGVLGLAMPPALANAAAATAVKGKMTLAPPSSSPMNQQGQNNFNKAGVNNKAPVGVLNSQKQHQQQQQTVAVAKVGAGASSFSSAAASSKIAPPSPPPPLPSLLNANNGDHLLSGGGGGALGMGDLGQLGLGSALSQLGLSGSGNVLTNNNGFFNKPNSLEAPLSSSSTAGGGGAATAGTFSYASIAGNSSSASLAATITNQTALLAQQQQQIAAQTLALRQRQQQQQQQHQIAMQQIQAALPNAYDSSFPSLNSGAGAIPQQQQQQQQHLLMQQRKQLAGSSSSFIGGKQQQQQLGLRAGSLSLPTSGSSGIGFSSSSDGLGHIQQNSASTSSSLHHQHAPQLGFQMHNLDALSLDSSGSGSGFNQLNGGSPGSGSNRLFNLNLSSLSLGGPPGMSSPAQHSALPSTSSSVLSPNFDDPSLTPVGQSSHHPLPQSLLQQNKQSQDLSTQQQILQHQLQLAAVAQQQQQQQQQGFFGAFSGNVDASSAIGGFRQQQQPSMSNLSGLMSFQQHSSHLPPTSPVATASTVATSSSSSSSSVPSSSSSSGADLQSQQLMLLQQQIQIQQQIAQLQQQAQQAQQQQAQWQQMRFQSNSGTGGSGGDHNAGGVQKGGPPGLDVPNQQDGNFFLNTQQGQPHRHQQQQQWRH